MKTKSFQLVLKILTLVRFYRLSSFYVIARHIRFACFRAAGTNALVKANVFDFNILVPADNNGIGRALYVYQGRELDHKWMLEKVLNAGDHILDLGANIGYYVLLEARILHNSCKILAVEPDPRNARILLENIEFASLGGVVTWDECALSDFTGEARFVLSARTNLSRIAAPVDDVSSAALTTVKVYDFAEYAARQDRIDLMRMDIEGSEVNIFASMVKAKELGAPVRLPGRIVFETHNYGKNVESMRRLMAMMLSYGYGVEYISSDDERSKHPVFRQYGYLPFIVINEMGVSRGLYRGLSAVHAAELISNWRGTRTVCLKLESA